MTVPTIAALPAAPSRITDDADAFAVAADAFTAALPTFGDEINAVGAAINAMDVNAIQTAYDLFAIEDASGNTGTSTTSVAVGTGAKSFTTQTGKLFYTGQTLMIASIGTPTAYMVGTVTSYTTGTGALVMNITVTGGSGTKTDWNIYATSPVALSNWTQIGSATPSGTGTVTFSNIPQTYADLMVVFEGLSHNTANDAYYISISGDNGSTWDVVSVILNQPITVELYGSLVLMGYRLNSGVAFPSFADLSSDATASTDLSVGSFAWRLSGGIDAIKVYGGNGYNFDGGTLRLMGR